METQTLSTYFIPAMLAIIMFGLGLNLTWDDFVRVKKSPRSMLAGLGVQIILVPIWAIALCYIFRLSPVYAVGLVLLSSTPGGPTAALFSSLARGNVALNISLTAVNTVIGIVFVPFMIWVSFQLFYQESTAIPMQTEKLLQVIWILLIPMTIGIFVNRRAPATARKIEKYVKIASIVFLVVLIVGGFAKEWNKIVVGVSTVGPAVLIFNLGNLALGYAITKLVSLPLPDRIATVMEVGVHNCTVALSIALSPLLLNSTEMAVPAALYAIVMYITAFTATFWFRRQVQPTA